MWGYGHAAMQGAARACALAWSLHPPPYPWQHGAPSASRCPLDCHEAVRPPTPRAMPRRAVLYTFNLHTLALLAVASLSVWACDHAGLAFNIDFSLCALGCASVRSLCMQRGPARAIQQLPLYLGSTKAPPAAPHLPLAGAQPLHVAAAAVASLRKQRSSRHHPSPRASSLRAGPHSWHPPQAQHPRAHCGPRPPARPAARRSSTFPLVFAIQSAFSRRDRGLSQIAQFKASAVALYYHHRDWAQVGRQAGRRDGRCPARVRPPCSVPPHPPAAPPSALSIYIYTLCHAR
jgi:hypothetical protein